MTADNAPSVRIDATLRAGGVYAFRIEGATPQTFGEWFASLLLATIGHAGGVGFELVNVRVWSP